MELLVCGDKILFPGSRESVLIYEYRGGEVVGPRIVTVPPRPQDFGGGWYMPAGVTWYRFVWMTPDMDSPTWVVSVSETSDEKWLGVNHWNTVEETHSKTVMVSTCGAGQVIQRGRRCRRLTFKNPLLMVMMCDEEDTQRILVSDVETGNVIKTVTL